MQKISGNIADLVQKTLFYGNLLLENGRVVNTEILEGVPRAGAPFIIPGFTDAHVHIESSLLPPSEFARMAVLHGTVATVSDPHEIANVCGMDGVDFMIQNGKTVPFKFYFGAPSCVPATKFETAGAVITTADIKKLMYQDDIHYLSEMMNWPGVLNDEAEVMEKIAVAQAAGKPIDGHAPGLMGENAIKYIQAGISTDHECFTAEEALHKLQNGMKILIREGSAARNFDALIGLLPEWHEQIMFCSDDKHPDSLLDGHINKLCARAVEKGMDIFHVLQAACANPVRHYNLNVGLLQPGDPADFILLKDLKRFDVLETWIDGEKMAARNQSLIERSEYKPINNFGIRNFARENLQFPVDKFGDEENMEQVYVIEALDGQLITNKRIHPITDFHIVDRCLESNIRKDLLKIVVVNRYNPAPVAKSFINGFGLKQGALAGSVAHDSHNIVAVGVDDESLFSAISAVIEQKGGLSAACGKQVHVLPLPIAGLMSNEDAWEVAENYTALDQFTRDQLGSTLASPFMTLSFMALLVIPHLKLSDSGLFDGDEFRLI